MAKRMQYGEETVVIRVPKSMVPEVKLMMENRKVIESQKLQISEHQPVVVDALDAFMAICSAQMVELLSSSEVDLISRGLFDQAKAISGLKSQFSGVVERSGSLLESDLKLQ